MYGIEYENMGSCVEGQGYLIKYIMYILGISFNSSLKIGWRLNFLVMINDKMLKWILRIFLT